MGSINDLISKEQLANLTDKERKALRKYAEHQKFNRKMIVSALMKEYPGIRNAIRKGKKQAETQLPGQENVLKMRQK
jgi:hypothetical protein